MATRILSQRTTTESGADPGEPQFQHFHRYHKEVDRAQLPGGAVVSFAEKVADVAGGIGAIVELLADDSNRQDKRGDLDEPEDSCRPLLTAGQVWHLRQLALQSARLLESEADQLMDWAYKYHTLKGQAERVRMARDTAEEVLHG